MVHDLCRNIYSDFASGDTAAAAELSDVAFVQRILDTEAALARVVGRLGLVEQETVDKTLPLINAFVIDMPELSAASAAGGNPAIPVAKGLKALAKDAGVPVSAIHTGATSQDVIDTALVLCLRAASNVILADLAQVRVILTDLVKTHRDTTVIGRTLGQQAVPTTFGAIAAGWLESVVEAKEDLEGAVGKLPVQYAGAAGNLASSYPDGVAIHDALASELDLAASPLVWHTNRVPLVRVSNALATVAGAVRKIAGDVVFHAATEVSELREAAPGGSSAMPHKANPAAAVACDGYARRAPGLAATMLDAMDQRMQRATGAWHAEWQTVRDLAATTASAVNRIRASLDGITVDTDAMDRNLELTDGAVLAEALGKYVPRAQIDEAVVAGELQELMQTAAKKHGFSTSPADHTGHAGDVVDAVLRAVSNTNDNT